jgi:O-Antigen ligase
MALTEQIQRRSFQSRARLQSAREMLKIDSKLPLPIKLYFLSILLPIEFNAGGLLMSGVRAILLVLLIPMVIKLLIGHYGRLIWTDLLFFLFCPWAIYTLHLNNPDQAFSFGGSVSVEFFGGYMLARAYIRTPEAFAGMCKALFLLIALTLPFAVFESQTGRALIPETLNKIPGFFSLPDFYNEDAGIRMGLERSQVIFAHPIHYGLFCSTAFSLAYVGFKNIYSTFFRYLVSFLITVAVFLSLSSGALLPMVLQFGLIFWAFALDKVRSRWTIFMVLIGIAYVVVDAISNRTPIQVFLSYATFSPHNAYWRVLIFEWGMKNVWMNPLYGLGLNQWVRAWFMHGDSMDNFWLLTTVRYGIPAFFLVGLGFAIPLWKISRRKIDEGTILWQFRRAWMITMVGLVLSLCTVDVWATMFSYVAFLFGSGIWLLSVQQPTTEAAKPTKRAARNRRAPRDDLQIAKTMPADSAEPASLATSPYSRFAPQLNRK